MNRYISYIKQHKKTVTALATIVVLFFAVASINAIQKNNRNYFIDITDYVEVNCKAHIWQDTVKCEPSEITGTFSNYDDLEFRSDMGGTVTDINENNFTVWENGYISYQYEQFNPDDLRQGHKVYTTLRLRGGKHHEAVVTKVIEFNYFFSEEDIQVFSQKHNEWKLAEEKRKAEEAAKAQADEDEAKNAEEDNPPAEEQPAETSDTQASDINMDDMIYDVKALCERYAESKGYPNAEIKTMTMRGIDVEDGTHYRVIGELYIDEGWTSSERAVGTYGCTADYNEWVVKSANLNSEML